MRKACPTLKAATSFNIVVNGAPELSGCDFSAEVGMLGAKGEGKMTRNRSLLLGVAVGLFGALAVLTARYVAVVLAG